MRPNFFLSAVAVLAAVVVSSCGGNPPKYTYMHPQRNQENPSFGDCQTARTYGYTEAQSGEFDGFRATVHSQVKLNHKLLTAEDVAQLAWASYHSTDKKWPFLYLPKDEKEKVYQMLSDTHVIVAKNNDELQRVWGPHSLDFVVNGRMLESHRACFEPVNNTYFFTIVADRYTKKDIRTLTHEMAHAVSAALFSGNADPEHLNPDLWEEKSDVSVESGAIRIYNNLHPMQTPQ